MPTMKLLHSDEMLSGRVSEVLIGCHRFDSYWEHSDFSFNPSIPVSLIEKHHLSH